MFFAGAFVLHWPAVRALTQAPRKQGQGPGVSVRDGFFSVGALPFSASPGPAQGLCF